MPKKIDRLWPFVEQEIGNAIDLQRKYNRRASKETTSFFPIEINGKILQLLHETATAKKTDLNDYMLQLILTGLNNELKKEQNEQAKQTN